MSKSPMKIEDSEQRRNYELEEQIRNKLYRVEQVQEEDAENEIDELSSNNIEIHEGKKAKAI